MWIRKKQRDIKKGVDSPVPTQVVSNEEFIPRPQTPQQAGRAPDRRDGRGEREEARHGPPRLHGQLHGPGHLLPRHQHGLRHNYWDVDEAETLEPAATDEKWPKGEYFIIDVQAHFTNGVALGFRNDGVRQEHGLQSQERCRGLQLPELRQGDVLRQRNHHGRDLRRARQGETARRQGQGARRAQAAVGRQSCRAG